MVIVGVDDFKAQKTRIVLPEWGSIWISNDCVVIVLMQHSPPGHLIINAALSRLHSCQGADLSVPVRGRRIMRIEAGRKQTAETCRSVEIRSEVMELTEMQPWMSP